MKQRQFIERVIRYFEAMCEVRLSESELASFDRWKANGESQGECRADSDWPGWIPHIGSRPKPVLAVSVKSKIVRIA